MLLHGSEESVKPSVEKRQKLATGIPSLDLIHPDFR